MTRATLAAHHDAQRKLNEARILLKQMRLRAYPKAQTIDELPKATGTGRKVEELALVIADLADKVHELEAEVALTRPAVIAWVHEIDEPRPRMIASLRVLCGLPWERVAYYTGLTPEAVRTTFRRLMEEL